MRRNHQSPSPILPVHQQRTARARRSSPLLLALCLASMSACTEELDVDELGLDASASDDTGALPEDSDGTELEPVGPSSIVDDAQPLGSLSCTYDNDCRTSCECTDGSCAPIPGLGPVPPAGYCDEPPVRTCSTALDCRSGCSCLGGICAGGVSPQPPDCHLPPPDAYEYDDTWPNYSSYVGPQEHSFHTATDKDWIGVHIAQPGTVRFETHSLSFGTDTRLKVFAWDGNSKGALLGSHDDVGGWWFDPESKRSIVDLEVGPDSLFLIKVINESDPSIYTTSPNFPTYTLELSYL